MQSSATTLLGPDVLVNASVAPGTPPDQVVARVLGRDGGKAKTTTWVLAQVKAMLTALPEFKDEAIQPQLEAIAKLVEILPTEAVPSGEWADALIASARVVGASRVITDHPDLLEKSDVEGIEFMSTEAWLLEQAMPPPPPKS